MNWQEKRANERKIKEIEQKEKIRLQKEEQGKLDKKFKLIYDESLSIFRFLFPDTSSQSCLKHAGFSLIRSSKNYRSTSEKINSFIIDQIDENNIDAVIKETKRKDLNIVAFVYLFWKNFTPNHIARNKHSQIIDLYFEQSNLKHDPKIPKNMFKNDMLNFHRFLLNSQIQEVFDSLGIFRKRAFNEVFNDQSYRPTFKEVVKNFDNLKKFEEQSNKLRKNYHLMYLLYNFYEDYKIDFDNSLEEFQIIREDILNEEKKFNSRIKFLNNLPSIEELDKELGPQRLNSWRIIDSKKSDLDSLDDWEITELIILDALSQVKGNPAPDFDLNDLNNEKSQTNKEKSSKYSSTSGKTYYSTSSDRYMTRSEIEHDHIYIDGVGWMHEDEVGTDR